MLDLHPSIQPPLSSSHPGGILTEAFTATKKLDSLTFSQSTNAELLKFIYTGKYVFHTSFVSCLRNFIPHSPLRKDIFRLAKYNTHNAQKNVFDIKYPSLHVQMHVCLHSEMLIIKAYKHISYKSRHKHKCAHS